MNKMQQNSTFLFNPSSWLLLTVNLNASAKGILINLIAKEAIDGALPNDMRELAMIANIDLSEQQKFEKTFHSQLKQFFTPNEHGLLRFTINNSCIKRDEAHDSLKIKYSMIGHIIRTAKKYREFEIHSASFKKITSRLSNEQLKKIVSDKRNTKNYIENVFSEKKTNVFQKTYQSEAMAPCL